MFIVRMAKWTLNPSLRAIAEKISGVFRLSSHPDVVSPSLEITLCSESMCASVCSTLHFLLCACLFEVENNITLYAVRRFRFNFFTCAEGIHKNATNELRTKIPGIFTVLPNVFSTTYKVSQKYLWHGCYT